MLRQALVATTLLLAAASPAAPQEVPVARDFSAMKVTVNADDVVVLVAGVRDQGGRIAVCATVWLEKSSSSTRALVPDLLRNIRFRLGTTQLTPDVTRFPVHDSLAAAEASGKARCVATRIASAPALLRTTLTLEPRSHSFQSF
jgi:hypothetical protein